jgi:hypothetical protein
MKFIAHRGNITGIISTEENRENYIDNALLLGFDVEIDVWLKDATWFLGHDEPTYKTTYEFLTRDNLWVHCKNLEAFYTLQVKNEAHFFWHQSDKIILTNKNKSWNMIGEKLGSASICVLPELANYSLDELKSCSGICSDFIGHYKSLLAPKT